MMRALMLLAPLLAALVAATAKAQPPGDECGNACGIVQSIRMTVERTQWTPLGATPSATVTAAGGMTESVTQYQIGPQLKNQGLVIVGAAGGAAYAKRPTQYEKPRWDVTFRMDNGNVRIVPQSYEPLLREGDRVRVLGTQLDLVNP
jgi:outer membrane lipoprotein SlyB